MISLGAGILMVLQESHERIYPPTVLIVSKVGAGDSTIARIVLSLALGNALRNAVRFATAAVIIPGTELCRRKDIECLYEQFTLESTCAGRERNH